MLLANVIFPAYYAAYLGWLFLPLPLFALLAELGILRAANPETRGWPLIGCVLGMNLVSTLAGVLLAPLLFVDSGLVVRTGGILDGGPDFGRLSRLSFLQAGILSVVIEVAVVFPFRQSLGLRRIALPIAAGNLVSYVILYLAYHALFGIPPW